MRVYRIIDLETADYGEYTCIAANRLGTDQQTMTLFGETDSLLLHA